jgi:glycosyltransferase involved in cell wall biosynthesis
MSGPLLTVLIPNFNYGRFLRQAIDSALLQTYRNIEVVVVDDGSTDQSRAIIAEYGDRIVPVLKPNGGHASAVNTGFEASNGDIICLLDSDDWFFPDKGDRIAKTFEEAPRIQWVFHPLRTISENGSSSIHPPSPKTMIVDERVAVLRGKLQSSAHAPATSGLCFSRAVLATLLPMPIINSYGDNYLKFAAMSSSVGMHLDAALGVRRMHGANDTLGPARLLLWARMHLLIAQQLRLRFPQTSRFADRLFSRALAAYVRTRQRDRECEAAIIDYVKNTALVNLVEILPRTLYHSLRMQ